MNTNIEVNIPTGTDINLIIANMQEQQRFVRLDEKELMFDQSIYADLPIPLSNFLNVILEPQQRDMALLTCITILGSIVKNYTVVHRAKIEGCQLSTYIIGNASSGKGFVHKMKSVGEKYHDQNMQEYTTKWHQYKFDVQAAADPHDAPSRPSRNYLFLSPNTTKAALVEEIRDTNGFGLLFAPEADTLFQANKGEHGGFSDLLRHALHGESYSVNRKEFHGLPMEIKSVRMGILLTSTLDQCFKLIPTYENGLFSRFIFYLLSSEIYYKAEDLSLDHHMLDAEIQRIADAYLEIGTKFSQLDVNVDFSLTHDQIKQRDYILSQADEKLRVLHNGRLQSNINRMSLIFTRFCMLLSLIREYEKGRFAKRIPSHITCGDIDFNICVSISGKLLNHLQILDSLYEAKNPKQRGVVFLPKDTSGNDAKKAERIQLSREALRLRSDGLTYRAISDKLFNSDKHGGTVYKFVSRLKAGSDPFPFPETETATNSINVKESLKNTFVSVFEDVQHAEACEQEVSLLELLTSSAYKMEVTEYRNERSISKRSKMKRNILAFTTSGSFNGKRAKANLEKHSGFICVDIDKKENEHIINFTELKTQLANVSNVAFCAHSISGEGYYVLIPISNAEMHEGYFDQLLKVFKVWGINIDKACKDVSRLRIISYDPKPYIAKFASRLSTALEQPKTITAFSIPHNRFDDGLNNLVKAIVKDKHDITESYQAWFEIGCALANDLREKGREYFHQISQFHKKYSRAETDKQFDACLRKEYHLTELRYTMATVFYHAKKAGIA